MGTMSTGTFPQDLRPGIRMWFGSAYENYETEYDKILDVKIPDDRAYEEDAMLSGLGLTPVKSEGAPVAFDSGNQLFSVRYPHVTYGLGFAITMEMLEDGIALKKAELFSRSLKQSMLRTREIIAANVYVSGFSTETTTQGGDGVALFSNAHPTPAGNQSNVPSVAASLSEAAIEQAAIDIAGYKDNRGIIIKVLPKKLVIPKELAFTARRILASPLRSGSADNDINALRDMGIIEDVVVNHYLTSTTNWFVRTDQEGLNFFNRKDIELSDDNEFDTENAKFKGLMRFSVGHTDFRAGYGVNA